MRSAHFWDFTQCGLVDCYRRFRTLLGFLTLEGVTPRLSRNVRNTACLPCVKSQTSAGVSSSWMWYSVVWCFRVTCCVHIQGRRNMSVPKGCKTLWTKFSFLQWSGYYQVQFYFKNLGLIVLVCSCILMWQLIIIIITTTTISLLPFIFYFYQWYCGEGNASFFIPCFRANVCPFLSILHFQCYCEIGCWTHFNK
jgi:hypothetical protein